MCEDFQKAIPKHHYPVPYTSIKFWTQFRNCVYKSLNKRQWKESSQDDDWDIAWIEKETVAEVFDKSHLSPTQRINHFRNHFELTRKDNLIKNLKRHKRALEKEGRLEEALTYNFFPVTYNLPTEYSIFSDEFKRGGNSIWIMKPIGKSQGRGIFLFKKLSQVADWKNDPKTKAEGGSVENYVVQKYINNPLLIGGKKFDLRIYSLVTSYSPLTVYLYRDGFARFTHHRYDNSDISNTYVHLTNVAVQKHSENYDRNLGGKWDLRTLKLYLLSKYGQEKVNECFSGIQQLIIKTFQSVQKVITNDKHCFELYGFDILINSNLKPWVLEVNGSPSMTGNTKHDCDLKCGLLDDVFTIIDMERILSGQEEQIGGFDLICKGEPLVNEAGKNFTMLGCFNNRSQHLKTLSKLTASRLAQAFNSKEETSPQVKRSSKDPQSFPFILSTEPSSASRKARSKSTTKAAPNSGPSILNSTNGKQSQLQQQSQPTRTIFSKQLTSMTKEGGGGEIRELIASKDMRENREGSAPSKNRLRVYRGKTVHLPPVNNNYSSLTLNSNAMTNATTDSSQIDPSSVKPIVASSTNIPTGKGVGYGMGMRDSTGSIMQSSSQANGSSNGFSKTQYNTKIPSQSSSLSASISYHSQTKGLYYPISTEPNNNNNNGNNNNNPGTGTGTSSSIIPLSGLLAKGKTETNFIEAYNQKMEILSNSPNRPSSMQRKLKKEGFGLSQELSRINEAEDLPRIGKDSEKDGLGGFKEEPRKYYSFNSPTKVTISPIKERTLEET